MKYIRGKLWAVVEDNALSMGSQPHAHEIFEKTYDAVVPAVNDVVYEAVRLEVVLSQQ